MNLIIELLWTSKNILIIYIKYLCFHDISIHINFYENQFINEYNLKGKMLKILLFLLESWGSFLGIYLSGKGKKI